MKLIVISGVGGAGKTTYADFLGYPTIHIDDVHNYQDHTTDYEPIAKMFVDRADHRTFSLDGYVFYADPALVELRAHCGFSDNPFSVEVHFVYTSMEALLEYHRTFPPNYNESNPNFPEGFQQKDIHDAWCQRCMRSQVSQCTSLLKRGFIEGLKYVYRKDGYYETSHEDFLEFTGIPMTAEELIEYVDDTSGDPKYQTIESSAGERVREGYVKCWKTWENFQTLGIDFKDKRVADLGCFNGYFSFKAEEAGAQAVTGYDENEKAIKVVKMIARFRQSKVCDFRLRVAGVDKPLFERRYDLIMCLNMLNHIIEEKSKKAAEQVLNSIFTNCNEALFEIGAEEENLVHFVAGQRGFEVAAQCDSHREQTVSGPRVIVLFRKRIT